ncbi:MAG: hypothetical protein PGN26_02430 [Xylophilus ampelinus]
MTDLSDAFRPRDPAVPSDADAPPCLAAAAAASPPATAGDAPAPPTLGRPHARRLREVYRSAGWPCQDLIEVELLAAGMLYRAVSPMGHESMRLTDAGIARLAAAHAGNRAALSAHEALVERVARQMLHAGRIAWRGLKLRAQVPGAAPEDPRRWCIAKPDVFSIRNTTVEAYVHPIVHEIKVRRADLLADLRQPAKRAAYLDMAAECWYVLGNDAKGRCIADPSEVPPECGVLVLDGGAVAADGLAGRLTVARNAPRRAMTLPFQAWMALAKATPARLPDEGAQSLLGCDLLDASDAADGAAD